MAFLALLLTICEVSLVPLFHQSTTYLASTLEQGFLLALRESIIWLPALLFVYVQYATHTCQLVMQILARLVPSRELLSLLLVFGVGPCLASWGGTEVTLLLLLPLLVCLHQDRTRAITMGLLSLLSSPGSIVTLTTPVSMQVYGETLLLLVPVLVGVSLTVVWLSHRANTSGCHWGTALLVAGLTSTTAWLFGHLLPSSGSARPRSKSTTTVWTRGCPLAASAGAREHPVGRPSADARGDPAALAACGVTTP